METDPPSYGAWPYIFYHLHTVDCKPRISRQSLMKSSSRVLSARTMHYQLLTHISLVVTSLGGHPNVYPRLKGALSLPSTVAFLVLSRRGCCENRDRRNQLESRNHDD
nr:uncharacterized protein CTRU02_15890 [Colletotrichum truncatum]XP_036577335.1 uncharacterized protein CTRU02_12804 [Colletotrichum truncatum]XP_036586515.1 uncharacterized protein CTRU02_03900 [Colletotrichum truncatum]KAF6780536.1 hypothetical protein CTRU02_15890 [Colletotrichum truncatum]KAF6784275.1 hypothetical protein CTRU02_12804 [Colletotrichum truncatum]KAF6796922.1 hypothetical protein CTRU02_03900 [Colletotrichum truncatum]